MKFSKSNIKRKLRECREDGTLLQSLYGVIPHSDFRHEKITGILSFMNEPHARKALTDSNLRNVAGLNTELSKQLHRHFEWVVNTPTNDDHCILLTVHKNTHVVDCKYMDSSSALVDTLNNVSEYVVVVVIHFLPSIAAEQYSECSRSNYDIRFSNKRSFDGYNFSASLRLPESEFPNSFRKEIHDAYARDIADIETNLKKRFYKVERITAHNGKVTLGFNFKFNEMNRVNILKLINIKRTYTINVVSSLCGIGLAQKTDKSGAHNEY